MTATGRYGVHGVAFVRQTGGRIHVLLAVDEAGTDCFAGEPVLIVDHRPGGGVEELAVEGADGLPAAALDLVRAQAAALAAWIDAAIDRQGGFVGERLLGPAHRFDGPAAIFRIADDE